MILSRQWQRVSSRMATSASLPIINDSFLASRIVANVKGETSITCLSSKSKASVSFHPVNGYFIYDFRQEKKALFQMGKKVQPGNTSSLDTCQG